MSENPSPSYGSNESRTWSGKMYAALSPHKLEGSDQTRWTEVGVAFPSKDGTGMQVLIKPNLSVSGTIVLKPIDESRSGTQGASGEPRGEGRGFQYDPHLNRDLV